MRRNVLDNLIDTGVAMTPHKKFNIAEKIAMMTGGAS
jgi:hypothetical protein